MKKTYHTVINFFKACKEKVDQFLNGCRKPVKVALTVAAVMFVYLGVGYLNPVPLKADNIIGGSHNFVGKSLTTVQLWTYSVDRNKIIRTAHSPISNRVFIEIPLVGWVGIKMG
jgi:hypothetical protein